MSFELIVFAPEIPEDLAVRWPPILEEHGMSVEICPGFAPSSWGGGFLPFKLRIDPLAFPNWHRYGTDPLLAGFEMDFGPVSREETAELVEDAPEDVASILRRSLQEARLRTAMGRTVADFRLQCFAAATLARASGGVMLDGQKGGYFTWASAVDHARREVEAFENDPVSPVDWDLIPFPGWEALEAPDQSERLLMKYDDGGYHIGSAASEAHAAAQIGLYFRWCLDAGLVSEEHTDGDTH